MGESENDDFYELYEEYLEDDQISPSEEAFVKGFNEREQDDEPDDELVLEMEDIDLEWGENIKGEPGSEETSDDDDGF